MILPSFLKSRHSALTGPILFKIPPQLIITRPPTMMNCPRGRILQSIGARRVVVGRGVGPHRSRRSPAAGQPASSPPSALGSSP